MPQWIIDLFGEGVAQIVWVAIVAAIVCILAMAVIIIAKKAFGGSAAFSGRNRTPRLAVMDVARIDEKRRLVLVRRDEIEHLVMVGGQTDIVVESNILRVPAAAHARNHERLREHDWAREPAVAAPPEPDERVATASVTPFPEPQARPAPAERRQEPAAQRPAATEIPAPAARMPEAPKPDTRAPVSSPPSRASGPAQRKSERSAAEASEIVRKFVSRMPIGSGTSQSAAAQPDARREPPLPPELPAAPEPARAPEVPIQPRSRATPTLPPQRREPAEPAQPEDQEPARATADISPGDGERIEPELPMPPLRSAPSAQPVSEDRPAERAELRAAMNRAQSADDARVQDATVTAAAIDRPNEPAPVRKPLSVKSFAMAIQNRAAPPEMPQPPRGVPAPRPAAGPAPQGNQPPRDTKPQTGAVLRNPYASPLVSPAARATAPAAPAPAVTAAAAADAEPSLEDFLSAELDSDFGNDKFFAEPAAAEPKVAEALETPERNGREVDVSADEPSQSTSDETPPSPASRLEPAAEPDEPSAASAEEPHAAAPDPIFERSRQLTGSFGLKGPASSDTETPSTEAPQAGDPDPETVQRQGESAHSDWSAGSAPAADEAPTEPAAENESVEAAPAMKAGDTETVETAETAETPPEEQSAPQAEIEPEPEAEVVSEEPAAAEPAEVKSETAPAPANAPAPAPSGPDLRLQSRKLTLEEEMERLLGDLSFATSSERQRRS